MEAYDATGNVELQLTACRRRLWFLIILFTGFIGNCPLQLVMWFATLFSYSDLGAYLATYYIMLCEI